MRELRQTFFDVPQTVELPENPKILPDAEARRHVHIGTREIHPVQDGICLALYVVAKHGHAPARRRDKPHDGEDGCRLTGAVAADKADRGTLRDGQADIVEGAAGFIILHHVFEGDRRLTPRPVLA